MKKRSFMKKLGWLGVGVALILVYLVVYFFPTVIDINRHRRDIKDFKLKMQDLNRIESNILLADKKEKKIFRKTEKKFWNKIPVIKNSEEKRNFTQRIFNHIRETADKVGIRNLVITTCGPKLEILDRTTLPGNPEELLLLNQIKKHINKTKEETAENSGNLEYYSILLEDVSSKRFILAFSGDLRKSMQMINRLPNFSCYIEWENISVSTGKNFPFFLNKLKIYYREKEKKVEISDTIENVKSSNAFIDFNSPLLLRHVYQTIPFKDVKRELSPYWGKTIFIKKKGVQ